MSTNGTPNASPHGIDRLVVLAYVCALGMPPLGLILAVISARRPGNVKHAVAIILLSLVASLVWVLIIRAGGLNADNGSY